MKRVLLVGLLLIGLVSCRRQEPSVAPAEPAGTGVTASAAGVAQAPQQRHSPHETISRLVEGNRVTIVYGRPYTRSWQTGEMRKIWGDLVPFDKIWRLGADEATLLITQQAIDVNGTLVPAGAYTLWLLPSADGSAKLIVNREIGQWGIDPYHAESELARIAMNRETLAPNIDQFTMAVDQGEDTGGVLKLIWEHTMYSVPYHVRK